MNLQTLFKRIGEAITSVGFVIFFMLFLIIGMIFLSHTLFITVLESTAMTPTEVYFASWFLALGFEFTILITAVNTNHLNRALPIIFAVCSYFLLSFVLEAWTANDTLLTLIRHFISVMGAAINYTYAELFHKKWTAHTRQKHYEALYNDLFEQYNDVCNQQDAIQSNYIEVKSMTTSKNEKIKSLMSEVAELKAYKNKVESSLVCPYCNKKQKSPASLRAHKGHCSKSNSTLKTIK